MNRPQTSRAIAFLAKNPTYIGSVSGFDFYESPVYGDEVTLRAITPRMGKVLVTSHWELPNEEDLDDALFERDTPAD